MTGRTPAARTVVVNGVELAYVEEGDGAPLVLIMGLGADSSAWQAHVETYRERFHCFAVDNRGAGASSKPPGPYSTAEMADDYAGLVRALGLGAVRAVGVSMGGAIAQELAIRHPDLVKRMVLVSSWARCDEYMAEVFRHFAATRLAVSDTAFTQLLQLWIWSPGHFAARLDELRDARAARVSPWMEQAAFEAQCEACIGHDALARLHEIRVPTLITAGSADIFTPLRFAQELRAEIPGAELQVFPESGHAHHWECLDAFNTVTSTWLAAS